MHLDEILDDAQAHKAEELTKGYVRREPRAVKIVAGLLEKCGVRIDELMGQALAEELVHRADRPSNNHRRGPSQWQSARDRSAPVRPR